MECHHGTHTRAAANRLKQSSSPNTRPAKSCGSSGGAHDVVGCVGLCGMVKQGAVAVGHMWCHLHCQSALLHTSLNNRPGGEEAASMGE
jgi:hypothetical protein